MNVNIERKDNNQAASLKLEGKIDIHSVPELYDALRQVLDSEAVPDIEADFGAVTGIDSSGIALFSLLADELSERDKSLRMRQMSDDIKSAFGIMPRDIDVDEERQPEGFLANAGSWVLSGWAEANSFYETLADASVAVFDYLKGRRPPKDSITEQSVRIGVDALPIVALLSLLLGLTIAFQSAYQLRQFGANIYVANLVAISMLREFGPIIVGIVLAGRSGSAIAAELATMKVQEEIDALRMMGIAPHRFLILPRMVAITLVQPALTIMADLIGVFGGLMIGVLYLDLSPSTYISQTLWAVTLGDFLHGLVKSVIFAWIIGTVGCYSGLNVSGGASGVGRVTTRSVVVSIFLIIVADSIVTTISTFG